MNTLSSKFIKKFMRMAKLVAEDQPICASRQIGSVIVDPSVPKIVSTGYNGPAKNTPHPTNYIFLKNYFWKQLTPEQKHELLLNKMGDLFETEDDAARYFARMYAGKNICPRKLINCKSGECSSLCGCSHSEINAIINAGTSLQGFWLFLWSDVDICYNCAAALINAGIKKIVMKEVPQYDALASYLFIQANVDIYTRDEKYFLED